MDLCSKISIMDHFFLSIFILYITSIDIGINLYIIINTEMVQINLLTNLPKIFLIHNNI